jgi:Flp pilus assembly pilin Flp
MTRLIAELREKLAVQDQVSPLEYGLVAIFVVVALLAVIPGLAPALMAAIGRVFLRFA